MTPEEEAAAKAASLDNERLSDYLYIICGAVSIAVILWKVLDIANKWTRTIVCINNDHQRYFALPRPKLAALKKHVLYSPVLRKRHNREIQMSTAINVGTLPTRFQLLFLTAYFATNVAFCVIDINYGDEWETVCTRVRNRTGVLSVINMIPLFLLAGRNNPLIPLLGIAFDTYNLIHRWFGRIVILEAVAHTLAHFAKAGSEWQASFMSMFEPESGFTLWGFIVSCRFRVAPSLATHLEGVAPYLTPHPRPRFPSSSSASRPGAPFDTPFTRSSSSFTLPSPPCPS